MKKIFAFVLILGLCLSLCGCMKLDALRNSRVTIVSDDVLRLPDGTEYKRLPECEEFIISMYDKADYYAAAEDVPLLLLTSVGAWVRISRDGLALDYDNDFYYCRADVYDSVVDRIENGIVTDVYAYMEYDPEVGGSVLRVLTPTQAAAVEQIYTTQEPEKLPTAAKLQYEHKVDLHLYSADHLFRRDTLDICLVEGEYFLVGDDNTLYTVPAELSAVFTEIMAKKVGSTSNLIPPGDDGKETNKTYDTLFDTYPSVFVTENITSITFYSYYGAGKGSKVPKEHMTEIINWLDSFTIEREATDEDVPPGTNTYYVEIEYSDGTIIKEGLDIIIVDGTRYLLEKDNYPDCFEDIISKTSLK